MASSSWKPFVTFSICFPKSSVHIHHTLGSVAVHLNSPPRCLLKQNLFHLLPNYWWTLFLFTPEWSTPTRSLHTSLKLIHTHINTRALGLVCVLVNIVFTFRVTTLQQGCVSVNVCAVCVCGPPSVWTKPCLYKCAYFTGEEPLSYLFRPTFSVHRSLNTVNTNSFFKFHFK